MELGVKQNFHGRGLNYLCLKKYTKLLKYAAHYYENAMSTEGEFVAPTNITIKDVMECVLNYCTCHQTVRSQWLKDLGESGLLFQLARVIGLVPFGYTMDDPTQWRVIHAMIREILPEEHRLHPDTPGVTSMVQFNWKRLYESCSTEFPPGKVSQHFKDCLAFVKNWNDHLQFKEEEEDCGMYRRRYDSFYDKVYAEFLEENPWYPKMREAFYAHEEHYLKTCTADECKEYNEDASNGSFMAASATDEDLSSDDSDLDGDLADIEN